VTSISDALSQIGRYRTFLSHSSCIWDVVSLPDPLHSINLESVLRGEAFATCSADGSIRLWHLDLGQDDTSKALPVHSSSDNASLQNVYSKDILGVLYIGPHQRSSDYFYYG
jgi:WD40 repeat protein